MKPSIPILLLTAMLAGCAGGPTHDYYNPTVVDGRRFDGPLTILQVKDLDAEVQKCVHDGYTIIGRTLYNGKYPETVELKAQAKRVGANHIVYRSNFVPAAPGNWHIGGGKFGEIGGTDAGTSDTEIVFLGR